jgi:hypothetical protein
MLTLFKMESSVPAISDGLAQNVGILLFLAINIRRAILFYNIEIYSTPVRGRNVID